MQCPYLQRKRCRIQLISAIHEAPLLQGKEMNICLFEAYYLFIAESTSIEKPNFHWAYWKFFYPMLLLYTIFIECEYGHKEATQTLCSLCILIKRSNNSSGFLWRR